MKKAFILPILCILLSISFLHAQIPKGSLFLGGNIGLYTLQTHGETAGSKYDQVNLACSPVIGKAIKDNLIFGGSLTYSYNKYEQEQTSLPGTQKSNGYGIGIFLRKYKHIGKGFYVFLEGTLGGRYEKTNNSPLTSYNNYKRTSSGLSANPGISYAISKKLQLETGFNQLISINYSIEKGDKSGYDNLPYTLKSFNLSTSLTNTFLSNVYLGFRLLLS